MHYAGNVLEFNPADLPGDWKRTILPRLAAGFPLWISTSDVATTVERSELTRAEADPKFLSAGTLKVHLRSTAPMREEIVLVSFSPLAPKSWSTRRATDEEETFAKAEAKKRFHAITGAAYTAPVKYQNPRGEPYTIDLDELSRAEFVIETKAGDFLIMVFQLPGDNVGQVTAFHKGNDGQWSETVSFKDDFRARIPRIDIDGDGVPELLHSGPYDRGWDLAAFYPAVVPILRISPGS
jgi:hypothetical protein